MNALLILLSLLVCGAALFIAPSAAPPALMLCVVVSIPIIIMLARPSPERVFLLRLFVAGLLIRIVVGTIIYSWNLQDFFGGDANTYDFFGYSLTKAWHGDTYHEAIYQTFIRSGAGAWGMLYLVGGVYELIGRNMLAIQFINAAFGAVTPCIIYYSAQHLFGNLRVSRLAALLTAFFPSLVLWSSQALKDGLIVLALALSIFATLQLVSKVSIRYVIVLTMCLLALLSLRFYIFYMMAVAVVGAFIIGVKSLSAQSFFSRFLAIAAMGLALTWFGVLRYASSQFERYGNLQAVQRSRVDAATTAGSGFGKDVDVRTTEGALTAVPIGLLYLLFAPFPWQLASLRQSIAVPEMVVWWLCFPLLILGFWFAIKHRLREVSPILLFTTMLTLAYSLFQGNVGTAYRQRSQLLVFYFIFVAVGAILVKENAETRERQRKLAKQELVETQAARALARRKSTEPSTSHPALRES